MKKILITGATGFVGANLARRVVKEDFEVHILIRQNSNLWRIKDTILKLHLHQVDILQKRLLKKQLQKIKPQIIFHLANTPLYGGIHPSVRPYIDVNLVGTINLIEACDDIDYECFINTGSSAEYGPKMTIMKEDDICQPLSLYAVTKLAGTNYASYYGRENKKPIITFRLFSPFGPYDDPKRLVSQVIYNALANKKIFLSNPKAVRDYIYINDVADAYIKAIAKAKDYPGEIFNLGSGQETPIEKVVEEILKLTKSKSIIRWGMLKTRPFESKKWQGDIEKVTKAFNWRPKYSLTTGIKETVEWFKKNYNFYENKVPN